MKCQLGISPIWNKKKCFKMCHHRLQWHFHIIFFLFSLLCFPFNSENKSCGMEKCNIIKMKKKIKLYPCQVKWLYICILLKQMLMKLFFSFSFISFVCRNIIFLGIVFPFLRYISLEFFVRAKYILLASFLAYFCFFMICVRIRMGS